MNALPGLTDWSNLVTGANSISKRAIASLKQPRSSFQVYAALRVVLREGQLIGGDRRYPFRWGGYESDDLLMEDAGRIQSEVYAVLSPMQVTLRDAIRALKLTLNLLDNRYYKTIETPEKIQHLLPYVTAKLAVAYVRDELQPTQDATRLQYPRDDFIEILEESISILRWARTKIVRGLDQYTAAVEAEYMLQTAIRNKCPRAMRCTICLAESAGPCISDSRLRYFKSFAKMGFGLLSALPHRCERVNTDIFDHMSFMKTWRERITKENVQFSWVTEAAGVDIRIECIR
jgi:hypothetical protein